MEGPAEAQAVGIDQEEMISSCKRIQFLSLECHHP